ncbi:MAG: hypothetical protein AAGC43_04650 [Bacteroidota bacterium]
MTYEQIKDFTPWAVGLVTTIIALKKDLIRASFTKKEKKLEVASTAEDVEAKQLENIESSMNIYREIIKDLRSDIGVLKGEVDELKAFIEEQKTFIQKQARSLQYYEKKYGKIVD